MQVTALHVYPVKSLRGVSVRTLDVDAMGPTGDRRFMVLDAAGTFMTQRSHPQMARVGARVEGEHLVLTADAKDALRVPTAPDPRAPERVVAVWSSQGLVAEDCGDEAAQWLEAALRVPCRLVRAGGSFRRLPKGADPGSREKVGFADAYPFLVASEASLTDLNGRMEAPVPMDRFRPNIVVTGCAPFDEDRWPRIRIGTVVLRAAGPCARCIMTTTDQLTGERGVEPLRTLATYRRDPQEPSHVNFAQNFVHESSGGRISVGDRVEVLP
jgi:uncharacterized protein